MQVIATYNQDGKSMCATAIMIQVDNGYFCYWIEWWFILEVQSEFRRESNRKLAHPFDVIIDQNDELETIDGF
jgi:hypothetical protein